MQVVNPELKVEKVNPTPTLFPKMTMAPVVVGVVASGVAVAAVQIVQEHQELAVVVAPVAVAAATWFRPAARKVMAPTRAMDMLT